MHDGLPLGDQREVLEQVAALKCPRELAQPQLANNDRVIVPGDMQPPVPLWIEVRKIEPGRREEARGVDRWDAERDVDLRRAPRVRRVALQVRGDSEVRM